MIFKGKKDGIDLYVFDFDLFLKTPIILEFKLLCNFTNWRTRFFYQKKVIQKISKLSFLSNGNKNFSLTYLLHTIATKII